MNTTFVLDLFKKNVQVDPIVSVLSLNLLGELLVVDTSASTVILQKFESVEYFKLINEIITYTSNICFIEKSS